MRSQLFSLVTFALVVLFAEANAVQAEGSKNLVEKSSKKKKDKINDDDLDDITGVTISKSFEYTSNADNVDLGKIMDDAFSADLVAEPQEKPKKKSKKNSSCKKKKGSKKSLHLLK